MRTRAKTLGITSCTIITAAAVEPVTQIHDRMPVILNPTVYDAWLDPATPAGDVKGLLGQHLDGELQFHRVDRSVKSTKDRSDSAGMIEPLNPR